MSSVSSSSASRSSSSPSSTSSAPKSEPTKSSSAQKTSSDSTSRSSTQSRTRDTANITKEKEKAGATPDFSQSFGALAGQQAPAAQAQQAPLSGTFRQGMKGDEVKQLQEALNAKGARLEVDGKFGKDTAAAVRQFQEQQGLKVDGIAGKDTLGRLQGGGQTPPAEATPAETQPGTNQPGTTQPGGRLDLPQGYESLEKLSGELAQRDPRFNTDTASGRAATALALAIGGTEVYGKGTTGTDFFTRRGGTGNNMLGFAQFNQKYHAGKTNTPEKYTKFLGDILTGQSRMPNSRRGGNHVEALTRAMESGQIRTGQDLRNFMTQRGFGGSNWQGIDDGWGRNPGLANALVGFLNGGN